ncbi:MAG: hypothetical protein J5939_05485 [Bacteroidales bacterium]|nr:hypothetical protein [Bacteroidales bacterium]
MALYPSFKEELNGNNRISPTHSAIIIYPNDIGEERRLELDERIAIDNIPFGFIRVPPTKASSLRQSIVSPPNFQEQVSCIIENEEPDIDLPILYAIWPVDLPIPDSLCWKKSHDVFIPRSFNSSSCSILSSNLENALMQSSFNSRKSMSVHNGFIRFFDSFLDNTVTVSKLKIKVVNGSSYSYITSNNGLFQLIGNYSDDTTLYLVLQTDQFTVTENNTSSPITISLGTIYDIWGDGTNPHEFIIPENQHTSVFRAADFLYHRLAISNPFCVSLNYITIHSLTTTNENGYSAAFYPATIPFIRVFASSNRDVNVTVGDVIHELGHYLQYTALNSFTGVSNLIIESFASLIGWYYGEEYYLLHGYSKTNEGDHINTQNHQIWYGATSSPYSPLFIDLFDSFNQRSARAYLLNDIISNTSFSLNNGFILCETLSDVIDIIQNECSLTDGQMEYFNTYYQWITSYEQFYSLY